MDTPSFALVGTIKLGLLPGQELVAIFSARAVEVRVCFIFLGNKALKEKKSWQWL
jgi:hypothetical protein